MSLIDIMLDEISDMTRDDKFVSNEDWRRFLEKHLKQSEKVDVEKKEVLKFHRVTCPQCHNKMRHYYRG